MIYKKRFNSELSDKSRRSVSPNVTINFTFHHTHGSITPFINVAHNESLRLAYFHLSTDIMNIS